MSVGFCRDTNGSMLCVFLKKYHSGSVEKFKNKTKKIKKWMIWVEVWCWYILFFMLELMKDVSTTCLVWCQVQVEVVGQFVSCTRVVVSHGESCWMWYCWYVLINDCIIISLLLDWMCVDVHVHEVQLLKCMMMCDTWWIIVLERQLCSTLSCLYYATWKLWLYLNICRCIWCTLLKKYKFNHSYLLRNVLSHGV